MVAEGESNAEIAGHLYLSESTIKQRLRGAYKLLGVRNRTEAAKTMKNNHLLEPSREASKPSMNKAQRTTL
jgi:DNA-binding NarL/FixJ family response regulator